MWGSMKNDKSIKVVGTLCKIGKQTILKTRLEAWLHNVHHEKRSWDLGMVTQWRLLKNYVPLISLPSGKADDFIVAQPLKC